MSFLRLATKVLLALALAAVVLVGLLCVPAVQTWTARQFLSEDSGITFQGVHARRGRVEVTGFRLERDGRRFTAGKAVAELSWRQLLFHHRAVVSHLVAGDCRWEQTDPNPPPASHRPSPLDVVVDSAELDGTAVWRSTGGQEIPLHFHALASARALRHQPLGWKARVVAEGPGGGLKLDADLDPTGARGRWAVRLTETDLAALAAPARVPRCSARGTGTFDQVRAGGILRVSGQLEGELAPDLLGRAMPFQSDFAFVRSGRTWRFERARLESRQGAARVEATSEQPFEFDPASGRLRFASPAAEGVRVRLANVPLAALPPLPAGTRSLHLDAGTVSGELSVTPRGLDGFSFRTLQPVHLAAGPWDADAEFSGQADGDRWEIRLAPAVVHLPGWREIRAELAASRAVEAGQPWVVEGRISAELTRAGSIWKRGSVRVSAIAGDGLRLDADVALEGTHAADRVTSAAHLEVDRDGGAELVLPLKFAFGTDTSDFTLDLTRVTDDAGERWYAKTSGEHTDFDSLRTLVGPWLPAPIRGPRDHPWWGNRSGKLSGQFQTFASAHLTFSPLDGVIVFTPDEMKLEDFHVTLPDKRQLGLAGGLDFHRAGGTPYSGHLTYTAEQVDAGPLFPDGRHRDEPWIEGKFLVHHRYDTEGGNFADLYRNRRETIEAESSTAIVRLLRVNVGDAVPEAGTTVGESVGGAVGSVVGKVFGTRNNPLASGRNPVTPRAEAVLQFTYETGEIGFDSLKVKAEQLANGDFRLVQISGSSETVRIEGQGLVGGASPRALSLDLRLSFRGGPADQLAKAGLIRRAGAPGDFVALPRPIHFGGTVDRIDQSQWHDFLAAAIRGR